MSRKFPSSKLFRMFHNNIARYKSVMKRRKFVSMESEESRVSKFNNRPPPWDPLSESSTPQFNPSRGYLMELSELIRVNSETTLFLFRRTWNAVTAVLSDPKALQDFQGKPPQLRLLRVPSLPCSFFSLLFFFLSFLFFFLLPHLRLPSREWVTLDLVQTFLKNRRVEIN